MQPSRREIQRTSPHHLIVNYEKLVMHDKALLINHLKHTTTMTTIARVVQKYLSLRGDKI
jgi:hypothetical protein